MNARMLKFQLKVTKIRGERGATAVEYGLMVGLIAVVILAAVSLLGTNISGIFQSVADSV